MKARIDSSGACLPWIIPSKMKEELNLEDGSNFINVKNGHNIWGNVDLDFLLCLIVRGRGNEGLVWLARVDYLTIKLVTLVQTPSVTVTPKEMLEEAWNHLKTIEDTCHWCQHKDHHYMWTDHRCIWWRKSFLNPYLQSSDNHYVRSIHVVLRFSI